jgi:hypothetical protein
MHNERVNERVESWRCAFSQRGPVQTVGAVEQLLAGGCKIAPSGGRLSRTNVEVESRLTKVAVDHSA